MTKLTKGRMAVASGFLVIFKRVLLAEYHYYYSKQQTYKSRIIHKRRIELDDAARRNWRIDPIRSAAKRHCGPQKCSFGTAA